MLLHFSVAAHPTVSLSSCGPPSLPFAYSLPRLVTLAMRPTPLRRDACQGIRQCMLVDHLQLEEAVMYEKHHIAERCIAALLPQLGLLRKRTARSR